MDKNKRKIGRDWHISKLSPLNTKAIIANCEFFSLFYVINSNLHIHDDESLFL